MKSLYRLIILLIVLFGIFMLTSAQSGSLTTTFAAGTGCQGNYFDVTANTNLTIDSFDIHINSLSTVSIYYKVGTYVGSETTAGDWTLLGSASVTGSSGTPTALAVGGLSIPAGQTYGILMFSSAVNVNYTVGNNVYANADMTITTGKSACTGLFGGIVNNRTWNGTINYTVAVSGSLSSIPRPAFFDGRINNYDLANPIIVYPHFVNSETGLIIFDVDGVQLLVISPQQIADAPDNPNSPVLIAEANGVVLYRISGEGRGLWQINAPQYNGKTYVMIFPELFHAGGYESFELGG